MSAWLFMLGGLVLWAVHFFGIYIIGSLFPGADLARWLVLGFSALCLGAGGLLLKRALRRPTAEQDDIGRWTSGLASLGYLLALVAIAYQALPSLIA